ncbi:hypothetical protein O181_117703, partial [Austropuccinia psidii MF-1]|nr:hypothetical protein [Austropuccinia psidii MF-1]
MLKEDYTKLSKTAEKTKRRLNQVLEEQNHRTRDREYLDQDNEKLFNVCQNIKPQTQGNFLDNPHHQEDIKPDSLLENKPISSSQYQYGYNMPYLEKEALKKLTEDSGWPKFCGIGEYDHMELIDYVDGLFIDLSSIQDYWITSRLNTDFKQHQTCHGGGAKQSKSKEMIHGYGRKPFYFGNDRYTVEKDPYYWCLRQSKRLISIDPHIKPEMRNHKLWNKLPGDSEHAVKCRCSKESTLDEISTTLQEVRIRTSIGRYNTHSTGDNRDNPTLEEKETHDSES